MLCAGLLAYLENIMDYSNEDASLIYSGFRSFNYSFPLLGGLFSDCWIGKFKTIVVFQTIYLAGMIFISGSTSNSSSLALSLCFFALSLIALGMGAVKPCVWAFGGDQFKLPEQHLYLEHFFYFGYAALHLGGALAVLVTPKLAEVHCNETDSCYPLALGFPTMTLTVSLIIFLVGKQWYTYVQPQKNNTILWVLCILNGIKEKVLSKEKLSHWLDYSEKTYGKPLVRQTKTSLNVIILLLVLQFSGSTIMIAIKNWRTQGRLMRSEMGNTVIRPSAMQFINYLLVVFFTPLICLALYILRTKFHLTVTPLRRIACGAFIGSVAMFLAAFISLGIEAEEPKLPGKGECHIRFYNPLDCAIKIDAPPFIDKVQIDSMGYKFLSVKVEGDKKVTHTISGCGETVSKTTGPFVVTEEKSLGYFFTTHGLEGFKEDLQKHNQGSPKIRSLVGNPGKKDDKIKYICSQGHSTAIAPKDYSWYKVANGFYEIGGVKKAARFFQGGIYRILIYLEQDKVKNVTVHEVGEPNKMFILWQLPQCAILAISKILILPTSFEFAYTQTPLKSLKTTITAVALMTTGLGGIIIVIVELAIAFRKQSNFYFTFGVSTTLFGIFFVLLAIRYKYVDRQYGKEEDIIDDPETKE
ncbi:Peptide transporter family 1-like Protein [Tribolium castaneum]|uniref:Peptide transporter family 1-like Protein n=1 Tax=Tribolium castaneum TaxID=7070 RepID=D6WGM1_TRICA|nr:Peptide transporter family 1-like Protein [Tribolium castaneum]